MTAMTSILIFAKQGDPADVLIAFIIVVVGVAALIFRALQGPAHYHVTIKNGLPYCPRCNRQVSYRRDVCRACGFTIKTYGWAAKTDVSRPTGLDAAEAKFKQAERLRAEQAERRAALRAERRTDRLLARAERRAARDAAYLARGVEPGPLAWYHVLPEWQQAALLGLAFAAPVVGLIVFLMR